MKKVFFVFIALFVLCAFVGASDVIIVKVKVQLANVRTEPSFNAPVVTQLKVGTMLEANGKKGDFYEIAVADESGKISVGYIHANTVEIVQAEGEEQAQAQEQPEAVEQEAANEEAAEKEAVEEAPKPEVQEPEAEVEAQGEFAQPRTGIGLMAGYALPSGYGGGLAYGASFSFGFSANFGIEISGLRFQSAVDEPAEADRETALSKGKLAVMPVQLSLVVRFPLSPSLTPYVLAGGGYFLNNYTLDSGVQGDWEGLGFTISEKIENSIGFHFGVGLDVFMGSKLAIGAVVKYCMSTTKGKWTMNETVSKIEASGELKDLKLKPFIVGLGLKYFF